MTSHKYNELRLRNIDPAVLVKFEVQAEKKGIPRNELIRLVLERAANSSEIELLDERYHELTRTVLDAMNQNTEELRRLAALIRISNIT